MTTAALATAALATGALATADSSDATRARRRHAVVTGAGTGIGAAIARRLAADGCALTLIGRRAALLRALAAELGDAVAAAADVTDRTGLDAALAAGRAAHGPIDILVLNAGRAASGKFSAQDFGLWRQLMAVNLDALHHGAQAALPDLVASPAGRLVVVASTAGLKGYAYSVAYAAAKHGAIGFVRALALECAKTPLTINAVCPGFTDTEIVAAAVATIRSTSGRSEAEARAELARFNPQGRLIDPAEVASAVAHLCQPDSRSITGQAIVIAGGEVM